MSLDVWLIEKKENTERDVIYIRQEGQNKEITRKEWDNLYPDREPTTLKVSTEYVFEYNITHNLGKMAGEAGIYEALWRPEELGATRANHLIDYLSNGLILLTSKPDYFKSFNPANGWGNYEGLVKFVEEYLQACINNPNAEIGVSR